MIGGICVARVRGHNRLGAGTKSLSQWHLYRPGVAIALANRSVNPIIHSLDLTLECIIGGRPFLLTFHSCRSGESRPGDRSYRGESVIARVGRIADGVVFSRWIVSPQVEGWVCDLGVWVGSFFLMRHAHCWRSTCPGGLTAVVAPSSSGQDRGWT